MVPPASVTSLLLYAAHTSPQRCFVSPAAGRGCRETSGRRPKWNHPAWVPQTAGERRGLWRKETKRPQNRFNTIAENLNTVVAVVAFGHQEAPQRNKTQTESAECAVCLLNPVTFPSRGNILWLILSKDCTDWSHTRGSGSPTKLRKKPVLIRWRHVTDDLLGLSKNKLGHDLRRISSVPLSRNRVTV